MKVWTIILVVVVAGAITFGQWAVVIGGDAFTIYEPTNHKVFTYGFPFQIVEGSPELPIRTPTWQVPFRFVGNFAVFLAVGLLAAQLIVKTSRQIGQTRETSTARP